VTDFLLDYGQRLLRSMGRDTWGVVKGMVFAAVLTGMWAFYIANRESLMKAYTGGMVAADEIPEIKTILNNERVQSATRFEQINQRLTAISSTVQDLRTLRDADARSIQQRQDDIMNLLRDMRHP
jgi:hypothetical protein